MNDARRSLRAKKESVDPLGYYRRCPACREKEEEIRNTKSRAQAQKVTLSVDALRGMAYGDYLKSEHWHNVRAGALRRASFACQLCNAKDSKLDVHHRTYERRGEERAADVIVLCRECHAKFHGKPVSK